MKVIKSVIPMILLFILIFSVIEPASAGLTVAFEPTTAHVGDTVTIIVTATNYGTSTWHPLKIYAPIPNGLKYLSHIVPDRVLQNYYSDIGIWDVNRMSYDSRGQRKQLYITVKVLPSAEGKTITATARFQQVVIEETGQDITSQQSPASPDTLKVLSGNGNGNGHGNGTGNGTGKGTGSGNGSGIGNGTGNGNDLINTMKNLTTSNENNPLQNLQTGGGGGNGKKAYEISENSPQVPDQWVWYSLAVLLITGLLVAGYFYGIRRDQ